MIEHFYRDLIRAHEDEELVLETNSCVKNFSDAATNHISVGRKVNNGFGAPNKTHVTLKASWNEEEADIFGELASVCRKFDTYGSTFALYGDMHVWEVNPYYGDINYHLEGVVGEKAVYSGTVDIDIYEEDVEEIGWR